VKVGESKGKDKQLISLLINYGTNKCQAII